MMEKVKIRNCEPIFDGKAHSVTLEDGRKCTAWNDKIDSGALMQAYASRQEISVEIKPYTSKAGKTGLNLVAIVAGEGAEAYDKFAKGPITESEKVERVQPSDLGKPLTPASLMSVKDIGMISGGLMHDYATISSAFIIAKEGFNQSELIQDIYDARNAFVKILEQNG